jgi:hypothetical protein
MADAEAHIERAERHVQEGAQRIAELRSKIAELDYHGHTQAAALAKQLLHTLEETQKLAIEHLRIELEMHPRKEN